MLHLVWGVSSLVSDIVLVPFVELLWYVTMYCDPDIYLDILCDRIMHYTDVEFRTILLWHDCIPYGLAIYAAIVTI